MGYTTKFEGKMSLSRPLTGAETGIINEFCNDRHSLRREQGADANDNREASYAPSLHCDWETDGQKLFWNDSEKAYCMDEWLQILIDEFFEPWGVKVTGKMLAMGQRPGDRWTMEVTPDQKVFVKDLKAEDLGITL